MHSRSCRPRWIWRSPLQSLASFPVRRAGVRWRHTLLANMVLQLVRAGERPAQHAKKRDEVGLSRPVGADQGRQASRLEGFQRLDGLEASDCHCIKHVEDRH